MGDPNVYQDPDYAEVGQQSDTRLKTEDGTVFHVNSELLSRHSKFFNSLFLMGEEAGQSTVIRDIKPDIFNSLFLMGEEAGQSTVIRDIKPDIFNSLFLMGEEAGQSTVIRDIKPDIFQILLNYMSTGKVLLTTENVMHLLVASDFLMIESLVDECRKFVLREKRVENVASYFITANRIKGLDLADQCRRFLVLCFEKAVMHSMDEVCRLPYVDLVYFLSHRSLNVSNEHTIWSVIEAWVQEHPTDRHPLVPGLLRCLSIHEISDELASNILSSPIIRKNTFYRDVGVPREKFHLLNDKMKAESVISFRNPLPIITEVRLPRFLHVVAKFFQDRDTAELYLSYDDSLDLWRKVGDISPRRENILVSGHLVYYVQHVLYARYEFSGFYYDLLRNEERSMALPHSEEYVVCEVGGSVYALQMFGTNMERYVYETDEWVGVRGVRFQGSVFSALNVNGLLHFLNEDRGMNKMIMRMYDPLQDKWWRLPSPTLRRCHAKSAVYQGKIFLVAGLIDNHPTESGDEENDKECGEELYEESDDEDSGDYVEEDYDEDLDPDEDDDDVDSFYDDHPDGELAIINRGEETDSDDSEVDEHDPDDMDPYNDIAALFAEMQNLERALEILEENESISKAVEVYDPKSNKWVMYPELPFRFSPAYVAVVKDRLYVYKHPRRPMTYWDGSGQWKIEKDPSPLFQHKFSAVKDEDVVRQIMVRNKEEDPTVWLETGLEKVVP